MLPFLPRFSRRKQEILDSTWLLGVENFGSRTSIIFKGALFAEGPYKGEVIQDKNDSKIKEKDNNEKCCFEPGIRLSLLPHK